jgi:uncharacterized protein DUF4157
MSAFSPQKNRPPQRTPSSTPHPIASAQPISFQRQPILNLQRTIGNQAVLRSLQVGSKPGGTASTGAMEGPGQHGFAANSIFLPPTKSIQPKLTVNMPGDAYEQEADRVAEQVMHIPETGTVMALASSAAPGIQRTCACGGSCDDCKKKSHDEHAKVQMKAAGPMNTGVDAPPIVHEVLHSPGQPLDATTRGFMEPRFGHDFSGVKVHTDERAAESAKAVGARAYTVGHDVVFGAGEYSPASLAGRQLMAHELAHTIQQQFGNAPVRRIQRALISYRRITWDDFRGTAPAIDPRKPARTDPVGALTVTLFDKIPTYEPQITANPTTIKCGSGRRAAFRVEATAVPDSDDLTHPQALLDQDKSWARDRYKHKSDATCRTHIPQCEADVQQVENNCQQAASDCEARFQQSRAFGQAPQRMTFGQEIAGERITAERESDCKSSFLADCKRISARAAGLPGTKKQDCSTIGLNQCMADEDYELMRLLAHEQGHFDITNVIARNARADLQATAATLSITRTECGEDAARDAARKEFGIRVTPVLTQRMAQWMQAREDAQNDYDNATQRGSIPEKQRDWWTLIKGGLKTYGPTAGSTPAPSTSPTPSPSTAPPAAPKRQP